MKIRKISSDKNAEIYNAMVFLLGDSCFAIKSTDDKKVMVVPCDAAGVRKFMENAERDGQDNKSDTSE